MTKTTDIDPSQLLGFDSKGAPIWSSVVPEGDGPHLAKMVGGTKPVGTTKPGGAVKT